MDTASIRRTPEPCANRMGQGSADFVAYYRVSTDRQGQSGLGLEAQRKTVRDYLNGNGQRLITEYVEIESGRRGDRPELLKALELCRRKRARLVIAKLDRLSRNVAFISALMESGVDFVAVDNPHATKLLLHMLAAFAEHERDMIGLRTRDALRAAKARGVRLGRYGRDVLASRNRQQALERAEGLRSLIEKLQAEGVQTLRGIAEGLNRLGIPTPQGCHWQAGNVQRLLRRLRPDRNSRRLSKEVAADAW
jgi:DNA invertase Pin-like site-specific DNA recombinase